MADFIVPDMVRYELYDKNCSEGGVRVDEWFNATLISPTPGYVAGDGTESAVLNISIHVDPSSFDNAPSDVSDQWFDEANSVSAGRVQFCLAARLVLPENEQYVDGSETLIIVDYDLTSGFVIEVNVAPVKNIENAEQGYGPEGYWCDADFSEMGPEELQYMGLPGRQLQVCVIPDERAREENFGVESLDYFKWVRIDANGARVEQVSVADKKPVNNGLTELENNPVWSLGYGECTSTRDNDSYMSMTFNTYDELWGSYQCEYECSIVARDFGFLDLIVGFQIEDYSPSDRKCSCQISGENPTLMQSLDCTELGADSCNFVNTGSGKAIGTKTFSRNLLNNEGNYLKTCYGWLPVPAMISGASKSSLGNGPCVAAPSLDPLKYIAYKQNNEMWTSESCETECLSKFRWYGIEDFFMGYTLHNGNAITKTCKCHVHNEPSAPTGACSEYGSTDCSLSSSLGEGRIAGADNTKLDVVPSWSSGGDIENVCYGYVATPYYMAAGSYKLVGNGLCQAGPDGPSQEVNYNYLKYSRDISAGETVWTEDSCEDNCILYTRLFGVENFFVGITIEDTDPNIKACYCWISNEEGSPGTTSGPTTVCSDYDADDCSWSNQAFGPIAGIEESTADSLNAWDGYERICWAYLQTLSYTSRYYGNNEYATLSYVGEGQPLDSNGNEYSYLTYVSDDGSTWTPETCRDACIKQTRFYRIEDGLHSAVATMLVKE
ncbi:MAG: hypothetical protein SGILL_004640 [Bacillariaceae sp.]